LIDICPIVLLQVPPVSVWLDRLPFYRLKRPRPFSLVATSANFPSSFRWPIPYFPCSQLPLADGRLAVLLLSAEATTPFFPSGSYRLCSFSFHWPIPCFPDTSFRLLMDDSTYFFFRRKLPLPFSLVAASARFISDPGYQLTIQIPSKANRLCCVYHRAAARLIWGAPWYPRR
jgi:hypothetical protein